MITAISQAFGYALLGTDLVEKWQTQDTAAMGKRRRYNKEEEAIG